MINQKHLPRRSSDKSRTTPRSYDMVHSPPKLGAQDQRESLAKSPSFAVCRGGGKACNLTCLGKISKLLCWREARCIHKRLPED